MAVDSSLRVLYVICRANVRDRLAKFVSCCRYVFVLGTHPVGLVRAASCDSGPCKNGGNCTQAVMALPFDDFTCVCPAGYEGLLCQTEIDEVRLSSARSRETTLR